jgi:hypothetical protein
MYTTGSYNTGFTQAHSEVNGNTKEAESITNMMDYTNSI